MLKAELWLTGVSKASVRSLMAKFLVIVLLLSVSLVNIPAGQVKADSGDHYFTETGHTVPAVFMTYWNDHGGLAIYGYPVSDVIWEGGYQVQYFERNRFELHPEFAGTQYNVELGLLGTKVIGTTDVGDAFNGVSGITDTPQRRFFKETGHTLTGSFLDYWNKYGGLSQFGFPITEEFTQVNPADGKSYVVQWFERARFEHHPEFAGTFYEVELGLLGNQYFKLINQPVVSNPTPQPQPQPVTNYPLLSGPHIGYGLNEQLFYQDHDRLLNVNNDIGFDWVKQQIQWSDTEGPKGTYSWDEADRIVTATQAHHVNVMFSIAKAPAWALGGRTKGFPSNPQDLGDFMKAMAAHFKGKVKAYEIWNEHNLYGETGQPVNAGQYVEMLKAAYLGIKAADPNAIVVSGGLTPTGYNDPNIAVDDTVYLEQMYQYQNGAVKQYFDVLGAHPYGYNNAPDLMWPNNPGSDPSYSKHGSFYFRRVEQLRAIMEKYGDSAKQVWVTEFGWCSDAREGGYAKCTSQTFDIQAQYEVRAFQLAQQNYPWMGVMFLWNLNFSTFQPWYTGPSHFSIINGDWTPRAAYYALKAMPKNH